MAINETSAENPNVSGLTEQAKRSFFKDWFLPRLWKRLPIYGLALAFISLIRTIFILTGEDEFIVNALYAFPWLFVLVAGVGLFLWRIKNPVMPQRKPKTEGQIKLRRSRWLLWIFGVRTPESEAAYGEKLIAYRRWSAIPVSAMSIGVFVLILLKLWFAFQAIMFALSGFNEETVVAQYMAGESKGDIIAGFMTGLAESVLHASPIWLQIPLLTLWLLAFVVDFIICATLATNKANWWRNHWAGILTAFITIP